MAPLIAGGVLELGKSIISRVLPDKEKQMEAEMKLLEMQSKGELKELEVRMGAIMAEANSKDPWTSRARPTFMYTFYIVILGLVLVAPVAGIFFPTQMEQFFANVQSGFAAIPQELWYTFTIGYLGYSGVRSYEKAKHVAK
ncbi:MULTISPECIES: 3TM-type holin [unclassified Thioalkalivibrio]|uniref:3TM-type holin n=1 Tax=unclassified Thioalkalivibrio TaxID=2621013 RepID=UPI00037AA6D9|nr:MULTISPECIES: 3TM-type holin [unclassified Thioalkalivibrio]